MNQEEMLDQISYLRDLTLQTRLRAAHGYRYFMLWGILVVIGYVSSIWYPPLLVWAVVYASGCLFSFLIRKARPKGSSALAQRLISLAAVLILASFLIFILLLMRISDPLILNAYCQFQVGVIYLAIGIFIGRDIVIIGCWLIFIALASLYFPIPWQNLWLAVTGGGGLFLTGLLLRNQVVRRE